jgi:hypothetical protein
MSSGLIDDCLKASAECEFRCCHQIRPTKRSGFEKENLLLIHPGELQGSTLPRDHIETISEGQYGETYGYCKKECFDQSKCNHLLNFKPLDCRSYPFFPVFCDEHLELAIDANRCPLARDMYRLKDHYQWVLDEWTALISRDNRVVEWIKSLQMQRHYQVVKREVFL